MSYELAQRAIEIAESVHRGQVDKGGHEYIGHVKRVAFQVFDDANCCIAACLHDCVEDGGVSLEFIFSQFGSEIRDAVDCLTKRNGERYSDYIERCAGNEIARRVKIADLKDNMDTSRLGRELVDADFARIEKYRAAMARLAGT